MPIVIGVESKIPVSTFSFEEKQRFKQRAKQETASETVPLFSDLRDDRSRTSHLTSYHERTDGSVNEAEGEISQSIAKVLHQINLVSL